MPPSRRPRHLRPSDWTAPPPRADDTVLNEKSGADKEARSEDTPSPLPSPATSKKDKKAKAKEDKSLTGNAEGGKVREDGNVYDQSLVWALQKTFFWPFWLSAVFLIVSSLLTTLAPLVTKQLLNYITTSYTWSKASDAAKASGAVAQPPHVGRGLGLAFGLFIMQEAASLFQNQYMQRGQLLGFSESACRV